MPRATRSSAGASAGDPFPSRSGEAAGGDTGRGGGPRREAPRGGPPKGRFAAQTVGAPGPPAPPALLPSPLPEARAAITSPAPTSAALHAWGEGALRGRSARGEGTACRPPRVGARGSRAAPLGGGPPGPGGRTRASAGRLFRGRPASRSRAVDRPLGAALGSGVRCDPGTSSLDGRPHAGPADVRPRRAREPDLPPRVQRPGAVHAGEGGAHGGVLTTDRAMSAALRCQNTKGMTRFVRFMYRV